MDRETFQFRIDNYTPATLPMGRLAKYLSQLAVLYGSKEAVHFDRLLKGSTIIQAWAPATEAPIIASRVRGAPKAEAPEDARRAYQRIDVMLRENNAVGEIKRKDGAKIIAFPGRKLAEPKPILVNEHAEIDGVVVRVGGTDSTIPVHLQAANGQVLACYVRDRAAARDLAALLFGEPIRVRGVGQWVRLPQGQWKLLNLQIDGWEALDTAPLDELLGRLTAIPGNGWSSVRDVDGVVTRIREGQ